MALIDVSELMTDPDFLNQFTIIRRTQAPNQFGENVLSESTLLAYGSVQNASGDTLARLPEGVQVQNILTIYTKVEMKENSTNVYSDQVVWKGKRFNVLKVYPWDNFGAGWFMVDCEMENKSL